MKAALLFLLMLPGGTSDLIDRRVAERWDAEGVRPAAMADDYEFLRRLSIDLRGAIPEPGEIRAFASDRDPAKREKTVDAWLKSDAFAKHWAARSVTSFADSSPPVRPMTRKPAAGSRSVGPVAVRSRRTNRS